MAKKATNKAAPKGRTKNAAKSTALAERRGSDRRTGQARRAADTNMGDAFIKLLQSPLVAELVAIAATAALASLAEHGFTSSGGSRGKRTGKAVKEAGKAAATAIGRRLGNEMDEIRKAAKASKAGATA